MAIGTKIASLAGFGNKRYTFKSPVLNKFITGRDQLKRGAGKAALALVGANAVKKLGDKTAGSPLANSAKGFMASDAGSKALGKVVAQKEQGVGFDLDVGGTFGGGAGGGSTTQGTSDKILAWIKANFVWVLVIIGGVILLPFLIGFMRKSSTKRIPSRRKPISPVRRKSSYAGKSMSTRAKQLAALARGRAKRLRNLRSKKK